MRAMLLDSLAAFILFAAALSAWFLSAQAKASSRVNIRFAAMLFAALAVAHVPSLLSAQSLEFSVALIVAPLGATALALGVSAFLVRPLPAGVAALAMALALAAGLAAALSGVPAYAGLCQMACVLLTLAAGAQQPARLMSVALAALPLLCGALCLMDGALNGAELFFAAALIGAASQKRVERAHDSSARPAVSRAG